MTAIAFPSRIALSIVVAGALAACTASRNDNVGPTPTPSPSPTPAPTPAPDPNKTAADKTFDQGQQTFRFDTFGDEAFWTGKLRMNEAVAGVNPTVALRVGLKVDADSLPASVVAGVQNGSISLTDPKTTIALLGLNAVVGVKAVPNATQTGLTSFGITCALCHSTVDNSFAPGIGHRLDGWPNRDLNVGAIVSLSPDLSVVANLLGVDPGDPVNAPTVKTVLKSWGPGKFDAELFMDGKASRPDGSPAATLIPPAFGLRGVNLHTYTGWGSITQWNAFVAVLEMHGVGNYTDARLDDAARFPIAAANKFGHVSVPAASDQVSSKLGALEFYELALEAPAAVAGTDFDKAAADRGKAVFEGGGKCATCHTAPLYTDAGWNMHTGGEIGIDNFQASRSPDPTGDHYRTTPLRGLFSHDKFSSLNPKRVSGYYHDGRFVTLKDVVDHYAAIPALGVSLQGTDEADLIEYLKSL